jgi:hypothetical protein
VVAEVVAMPLALLLEVLLEIFVKTINPLSPQSFQAWLLEGRQLLAMWRSQTNWGKKEALLSTTMARTKWM